MSAKLEVVCIIQENLFDEYTLQKLLFSYCLLQMKLKPKVTNSTRLTKLLSEFSCKLHTKSFHSIENV